MEVFLIVLIRLFVVGSSCRASRKIPNTKKELNKCIEMKKCNTFRPKERLHISFVCFGSSLIIRLFLQRVVQSLLCASLDAS